MSLLTTISIFIAIAIPFVVACIVIFRKKEYATTVDEFFTEGGNQKKVSFLDTSLAYAFQIAAISLFAFWGFQYGFWTIWVPIFWGCGYFLLRWFVQKDYIKDFIQGKAGETIHGLLNDHYKLRLIAILAAFASVLGLSGTAFFEAEFTATVISTVVTQESSSALALMLFLAFVAFALMYITIGGMRTIVKTDHHQLKWAYKGLLFFFGGVLGLVFAHGHVWAAGILFGLSFAAMLYLYFRSFKQAQTILAEDTSYKRTLIGGMTLFVVGSLLFGWQFFDAATFVKQDTFGSFMSGINFGSPLILGIPTLISLAVANISWQLIDVSGWQRMSSIRNDANFSDTLSKALKFIGVYSPVTWVFAIFLGVAIRLIAVEGGDAYNSLSDLLVYFITSDNFMLIGLVVVMIFTLMLIMFSTLDTLVFGISFTAQKDIFGTSWASKLANVKWGTIILTTVLLAIYLFVRTRVSGIDSILYTFYSFQLALFPTIIFALLKKSTNKWAALFSILLGICTPVMIVILGYSPYMFSPLFTMLVAFIVYILIDKLCRNSH